MNIDAPPSGVGRHHPARDHRQAAPLGRRQVGHQNRDLRREGRRPPVDDLVLDDDQEATGRLAKAAAEVDIVIDYPWGRQAASAMMALLTARSDRSQAMDWIQIGAVAGPTSELPSAVLSSDLAELPPYTR